jgi:hypothetical protein
MPWCGAKIIYLEAFKGISQMISGLRHIEELNFDI